MEPSPRIEGAPSALDAPCIDTRARPFAVGYRRAMAERVLTSADLNRALLARQFLLERSRLPLSRTLDRIGGHPGAVRPSSYIGLWSRLEGFELADLTRALERRKSRPGDAAALDDSPRVGRRLLAVRHRDAGRAAGGVAPLRQEALVTVRPDLCSQGGSQDPERQGPAPRRAPRPRAQARSRAADPPLERARAWIELVRAPPSGTWERRRADLYALADEWLEPPTVTPTESVEILLRRYLAGFGPARLADAANWAGLAPTAVQEAAEGLRLRRFRDEEDRELVDLPRAPLPGASTKAPPGSCRPGTRPCWSTRAGRRSSPRSSARSSSTRRRRTRRRRSSSTARLRASGRSSARGRRQR